MSVTTEPVETPPARRPKMDSVRFMELGKRTVVENFNAHRKPERSEELTIEGVQVVWFTKALGVWKMIIMSPLARGLLWEITYNSTRDEIYLDVYTKLNNIKISMGADSE